MVNPGYKRTEIGILPTNWELALLTDKCELLNGLTYTPDNVQDNGLLVLRSSNIQNGQINLGDTVFVNCMVDKEKYVKKDDILICVRNGSAALIGKCAKADRDYYATFGAFMAVLRGQNNDFIFQLLQQGNIQKHINKNSDSTINQITNADFKSIVIPWPSEADERETIATALSDIDALITNLEKLIAKKKAIKQGSMQELLTGNKRLSGFIDPWAKHMVKDLGVFYSGLSGKGKSDFGCGTAHYITFLNVLTNTKININALERVRVSEGESQNTVKKGDLFFNTSSETPEEVGMCAALLDDVENTYLNSFCFGLRITNPEMYPLFLSYYFNSQEGRQIMKVLAQGATRYNLSKTNFSETIITVPDKEEQIAIAHLLLDMDLEIDTLFAKLEKTRNMKKGMMSELLTGRIRLV